ncbi:secretin receptor-like [Babylonia areolata]|uniref:secretin receptor-like n=1 Tax=Babylonia areolata TaxID=304850 RepID=UPI003FD039E1
MASVEETVRILNEKKLACYRLYVTRQQEVKSGSMNYSGWCPVAWDDIKCWDVTVPGTAVVIPCPDYINRFKTHEFAVRKCLVDGTWEMHHNRSMNRSWTNYSACYDSHPAPSNIDMNYHAEQADKLTLMYTVGYCVSLAALLIAVFIMLYCRRLQCKSNTMHINLFLAFILRASLAFLKDRLFVGYLGLPQDVTYVNGRLAFVDQGSHWECRLIMVLLMLAISATQTWILMEGLYLYILIHRTILTERYGVRPYIVLGWAIPWMIVIPWVIVKYRFENTYCWNMQQNAGYFWILKGPWIAMVMMNFFFLLDIFRVLFMRVRSNHRHVGSSKYRKFAKFILVLIPLFGIMYIVIFIAFPSDHVDHDEFNVVHLYIEMGYNSFQGFILALLFCFLNEDVHSEIRRMWRRHRSRREDSKFLNRSLAGSTFRHVSRDNSSTHLALTPRAGAPWGRKKGATTTATATSSLRSQRTAASSSTLDVRPSPENGPSDKCPLTVKFSTGSLPGEHYRLVTASSSSSSSSGKNGNFSLAPGAEKDLDQRGRSSGGGGGGGGGEGGKKEGEDKKESVRKERSPVTVGIPAKIILLNSSLQPVSQTDIDNALSSRSAQEVLVGNNSNGGGVVWQA